MRYFFAGEHRGRADRTANVVARGLGMFSIHNGALEEAPELYKKFRDKEDGCIKVVLKPGAGRLSA